MVKISGLMSTPLPSNRLFLIPLTIGIGVNELMVEIGILLRGREYGRLDVSGVSLYDPLGNDNILFGLITECQFRRLFKRKP